MHYPTYDKSLRDEKLEEEMGLVQTIVNLGHSLRKEHKLKVRQPLKKAYIVTASQQQKDSLSSHLYLIKEELNVHHIEFESDESRFVFVSVKPNFKVLGKQMGPKMKEAKAVIEALSPQSIAALYAGKTISIEVGGESFILSQNEVEVSRSVKEGLVASCEGSITVALETTLDEELIKEGIAREIVNKINTMRRNENFEVTDRIVVTLETTPRVEVAFKKHESYISNEVLAEKVVFGPCSGTEWDINGELAVIHIKVV
jgi:isoleucyl-tRNA synthetase